VLKKFNQTTSKHCHIKIHKKSTNVFHRYFLQPSRLYFKVTVTISKAVRLICIKGGNLLKKISMILSFIFLSIGLNGCQNSENVTSSQDENSQETNSQMDENSQETNSQMLEQFPGYVVEKVTEGEIEKVLVVKGITQKEALEATFHDLTGSEDHENIIWFVSDKKHFKGIENGEQVNVWWDPGKMHREPSILTLTAEKVELIKD
jgi:hypothetical protein